MHPRVSVDNICFLGETLDSDLANWKALGAYRIGVLAGKFAAEGWDESVAKVAASGHRVATVIHQFLTEGGVEARENWQAARDDLARTIEAAAQLGAESVYLTSGGRGRLSFEAAAEGFAEAIAPCNAAAKAAGVPLLVETATAFHADINLTSTLRDTLRLAEIADLGVCIDLFACWTEGGLRETIAAAMPRCGLVQVSDYVLADRSLPCRAVPGDGTIPLERLIGWILDAGYEGAFDLELLGPRIDAEGRAAAVARAAKGVGAMLPA